VLVAVGVVAVWDVVELVLVTVVVEVVLVAVAVVAVFEVVRGGGVGGRGVGGGCVMDLTVVVFGSGQGGGTARHDDAAVAPSEVSNPTTIRLPNRSPYCSGTEHDVCMLTMEVPNPTSISKIEAELKDPNTWKSVPGANGPVRVPEEVEIRVAKRPPGSTPLMIDLDPWLLHVVPTQLTPVYRRTSESIFRLIPLSVPHTVQPCLTYGRLCWSAAVPGG
jgi:hypothetical protein